MRIRAATAADRGTIAAIQTASWRTAYAAVLPAAYLDGALADDMRAHWAAERFLPQDVVLLAEDPAPCGFIAVRDGPVPYIDNLHVLPGHRSGGIGRRLMQAAARALMETGRSTAYLWVAEANAGAMRFYRRLGGVPGERAMHDMVGHAVPAVRVEWRDLGRMAEG